MLTIIIFLETGTGGIIREWRNAAQGSRAKVADPSDSFVSNRKPSSGDESNRVGLCLSLRLFADLPAGGAHLSAQGKFLAAGNKKFV